MFRFLFGVLLGATGYWAYKQGWLPIGTQDPFDQVSQAADSPIILPTAQEISGRPSEPIPS